MGKIFHFGDSYATTYDGDNHFVSEFSDRLNYSYGGLGIIPGGSNEQILSKLLMQIIDIKEGDMLFFNFSFFSRGCYYDRDVAQIVSTNMVYNGEGKKIDTIKDYIRDIINYQIDYNEDYNRRLFYQFEIIFRGLHDRGIPVYYIFIEDTGWSDSLLKYGYNIKFPNGFGNWLKSSGYHKNQSCHYTWGVQGIICDYVVDYIKYI
jgi:hypothetical protein